MKKLNNNKKKKGVRVNKKTTFVFRFVEKGI